MGTIPLRFDGDRVRFTEDASLADYWPPVPSAMNYAEE